MARAAIFGTGGPVLEAAERAFFAEADPWGFILFARNVETPDQLRRLTGDLRSAVGRDAPVLIDQEGGRVARLRPPQWRGWAPAEADAGRGGAEALRLRYRIIAAELRAAGIDVNCMPILDLPGPGCHPIIDDRVLGRSVDEIAERGAAVCDGLMAGGVVPVIKHLPGHGRAGADSHEGLPEVDASLAALRETDFAPFRALADQPLGMTAHIRCGAIDAERPATLSPAAILLIREEIGFDGCLMTDDISMGALAGPVAARAEAALAAGCDVVLHCNGEIAEMEAVAGAVPALTEAAAARAARAEAARGAPGPFDMAEALARYCALTGEAA